MRIRYRIPFRRELIIADHWAIPFMGGTCRIVEEHGKVSALEVSFANQPVALAPKISEQKDGLVALSITGRDDRLAFVKRHLDDAMAFLHCFYDLDLATDEAEAFYESETPEEEEQIDVKRWSFGKHKPPLPLTFDMITRSIMAAEGTAGPSFEASLASMARRALSEQLHINAFRYAFLLIEAIHGGGQFKSAALKASLKADQAFRGLVDAALKDLTKPKRGHVSDTQALLDAKPDVDAVINHLVDKRGFYFHGSMRRSDGWRPDQQKAAEALALLAIDIAQLIAQEAAAPMFASKYEQRHFEEAMQAGAKIVYKISCTYREPEENFDRERAITINTPGSKPTPKMAFGVAQQFLRDFEHNLPAAVLCRAECRVDGIAEPIFEIRFAVASTDEKG